MDCERQVKSATIGLMAMATLLLGLVWLAIIHKETICACECSDHQLPSDQLPILQQSNQTTASIEKGPAIQPASHPPGEVDDASSSETYSCCRTDDGGVPLDLTLRRYLPFRGGFFIESGANDGVLQSNTYFFARKRHWKGILVEPAAGLTDTLRKNRPESIVVQAALVPAEKDRQMLQGTLKDEGSLTGKILAAQQNSNGTTTAVVAMGRSISSILDEHNVTAIDIWSLDVECFELQALRGLDFARHRPRYILIEVWEDNKAQVMEMMKEKRYVMVPGIDKEGSISGWAHYTAHRDYLWFDADRLLIA